VKKPWDFLIFSYMKEAESVINRIVGKDSLEVAE